MSDWFTTQQGIWKRLWQTLGRGVADARHPARLPTFATVSPEGWPEARTVVLRSADSETAALTVHTDRQSDKIHSLKANPRAALHVWNKPDSLQIRLQAEVTILTGKDTRDLWDRIPDHARQSYGVSPPPGTPIGSDLAYSKAPDQGSFAILSCRVIQIDAVHLGDAHRRVGFRRDDNWRGEWLSP